MQVDLSYGGGFCILPVGIPSGLKTAPKTGRMGHETMANLTFSGGKELEAALRELRGKMP
jgi:hypothetical protein